jgi:hypothetical protein
MSSEKGNSNICFFYNFSCFFWKFQFYSLIWLFKFIEAMPQPLIKSQINVKCSETGAASKGAASLFARKLKSFVLLYYSVSASQRQ